MNPLKPSLGSGYRPAQNFQYLCAFYAWNIHKKIWWSVVVLSIDIAMWYDSKFDLLMLSHINFYVSNPILWYHLLKNIILQEHYYRVHDTKHKTSNSGCFVSLAAIVFIIIGDLWEPNFEPNGSQPVWRRPAESWCGHWRLLWLVHVQWCFRELYISFTWWCLPLV